MRNISVHVEGEGIPRMRLLSVGGLVLTWPRFGLVFYSPIAVREFLHFLKLMRTIMFAFSHRADEIVVTQVQIDVTKRPDGQGIFLCRSGSVGCSLWFKMSAALQRTHAAFIAFPQIVRWPVLIDHA